MKLFKFVFFFLILSSALHSRSFAETFDPTKTYSVEELGAQFSAVHLTSVFPKEGVIKGKMVGYPDDSNHRFYQTMRDYPRGGSFWALGAGIIDHPGAHFETRPYGIVVPLRHTYEQLMNISPFDIFVLGDFDLKNKPGAVVFIPETEKTSAVAFGQASIRYYQGDLRAAIQLYLKEEAKTWEVQLITAKDGAFAYQDQALINGHNINSPSTFSSLLARYPYVSYGRELVMFKPGPLNAIRFLSNFIDEMKNQEQMKPSLFQRFNLEPNVILARQLHTYFEDVLNSGHPLFPYRQRLFTQLKRSKRYLQMAELDLAFRKKYGFVAMDLIKVNKEISHYRVGASKLVEDTGALNSFLEQIRKRYRSAMGGGLPGEK
jgi:hypothetical protein